MLEQRTGIVARSWHPDPGECHPSLGPPKTISEQSDGPPETARSLWRDRHRTFTWGNGSFMKGRLSRWVVFATTSTRASWPARHGIPSQRDSGESGRSGTPARCLLRQHHLTSNQSAAEVGTNRHQPLGGSCRSCRGRRGRGQIRPCGRFNREIDLWPPHTSPPDQRYSSLSRGGFLFLLPTRPVIGDSQTPPWIGTAFGASWFRSAQAAAANKTSSGRPHRPPPRLRDSQWPVDSQKKTVLPRERPSLPIRSNGIVSRWTTRPL